LYTIPDEEKIVLSVLADSLGRPDAYVSPEREGKMDRSLPGAFLQKMNAAVIQMRLETL
jgi:hypothetical protein